MSPSTNSVWNRLGSLKESHRNNLVKVSILSGPVALVLAVLTFVYAFAQPDPNEYDVPAEVGDVISVQNWADDYVLLWLGGESDRSGESENLTSLRNRTAAPVSVELASTPFSVQNIRPTGQPEVHRLGGGEAIWRVYVEAQVVVPGASSVKRYTYGVDVFENNGEYIAQALPHQVAQQSTPFSVNTLYSEVAGPETAIGQSAQAFAESYLVPQSGGQLGSTVSANFTGQPLADSPYTTVELVDVSYYPEDSSFDSMAVSPGEKINALITVRASSTSTTFNLTQLPVSMVVMDNGQWAVDHFADYVDVGATTSN